MRIGGQSNIRLSGRIAVQDPAVRRLTGRALVESVAAALGGYVVAAALEAGVIHWVRPTEWELEWISDLAGQT
jgi:hypothetical protein